MSKRLRGASGGIKVSGYERLVKDIEKKLGKRKIQAATDIALLKGAEVVKREIVKQLTPHKKTGRTINEITISKPYTDNGVRQVKIFWEGNSNSYVHINEFGSVKNPAPKALGSIERGIRVAEEEYFRVLKKEINKLL